MFDVANELFDDSSEKDKMIKWIKAMPLSARTVHDRTIMLLNQIVATQMKDINAAHFFSFAVDESTDVSNLSQFSVIARYVDGDTLHEKSLAALPIKETTRGEDLFKSFIGFSKEKNVPMNKLASVCTDSAPCMVGKNRGFVALLREHEKIRILSFYCILHQEAPCAQMRGRPPGEVISLIIQVVNFIVAQALNDRQFKTLLDEVGNHYPGLLLQSNVHWLSREKVLNHFAACLSEIQAFLAMKNVEHPELADTEWLLKFYYFVDMTEHLNQLIVKVPEKKAEAKKQVQDLLARGLIKPTEKKWSSPIALVKKDGKQRFCDSPRQLEEVFQWLRQAGLKLKPTKCEPLQSQVQCLGHKVSSEGVAINPAKFEVVEQGPNLLGVRELQGFLKYYRQHVLGFATIAKLFHRLVKEEPWRRTSKEQSACDTLCHSLTAALVLRYPNLENTYILDTDSSR
ncbi:general transcription factor II-I repeat domain-containing protein 2-like [Watersipora subatra]|uniref:general transcription factor II-I repeat domain-containing protein 2-like n=1 Tax=Watersipora subatra TaxID=2589382 RepID=UPI00355B9F9F